MRFSIFKKHDCGGMHLCVGQRQGTAAHSELGGKLLGRPVQQQAGRGPPTYHFKISPRYTPAHTGTKRFCGSFLRCKTGSQALLRRALGGAITAFAFGKYAVEEAITEAYHRLADALDFHHVDSQAKHHSLMLPQRVRLIVQNGPVRAGLEKSLSWNCAIGR